jgi:hypothetical protein
MRYVIIVVVLLLGVCVQAAERDYSTKWCNEAGGINEYILSDRTRVDCLTDEFAVEVDFAKKWYESVGQSLYYAKMTNKQPGIVLLIKSKKDKRYIDRLNTIKDDLNIKVWLVKAY